MLAGTVLPVPEQQVLILSLSRGLYFRERTATTSIKVGCNRGLYFPYQVQEQQGADTKVN